MQHPPPFGTLSVYLGGYLRSVKDKGFNDHRNVTPPNPMLAGSVGQISASCAVAWF